MQPRRILEVLLGAYLALLVLPAVALSGPWPVTSDRLPVLLGGGVLFALVIALGASSVTQLPARSSSLPAAVLAVGLPLLYLPVLLLLTPAESLAALVALAGLLAVLPGLGLVVVGTVIQSRWLRATATEVAVVTVGTDGDQDGRDWQLVGGLAVLAVAFVVLGAAVLYTGEAEPGTVGPAFGGLWTSIALLAHDDSSEVAVTDAGLRIDRSVTTWDALAGYRVTEDSVELVRDRWFLPDRAFDREEISDEAALIDAFDRFLPRLDGD